MTVAYFGVACQGLLAVVFAVSAASKLRGRAAFAGFVAGLRATRLVPAARLRPVAVTVVAAETAAAVLLLVPSAALLLVPGAALAGFLLAAAQGGFLLAAALLAVFTGGIAVALRRGVVSTCPCFGMSAVPLGTRHLVRNAALLAVALAGATLTVAAPGTVRPAGLVLALGAGALVASVVVLLDDLIDLFARPA